MNTTSNLIVFPHHGFLNNDYKVRAQKDMRCYIYFNGQKIEEKEFPMGESELVLPIQKPGEYTITDIEGSFQQSIQVENAIRLGSSQLKKAYLFDDIPYIIFVMKDRIHFYDPSIQTYIYSENFISPEKIYALDSQNLLFVTNHENGTSISIFSLQDFSFKREYECGGILAFSKNNNFLIVLSKSKEEILLIDENSFKVEKTFLPDPSYDSSIETSSYWTNEEESHFYCITTKSVICQSLSVLNEIREMPLNNGIGITDNGYLIRCYSFEKYSYTNMEVLYEKEHFFEYIPHYSIIQFQGHVIKNTNWGNNMVFNGETILIQNARENLLQNVINNQKDGGNRPLYLRLNSISKTQTKLSFYPNQFGIYIWENVSITYDKSAQVKINQYESDEVTISKYVLTRGQLKWIGVDGFTITYGNDCSEKQSVQYFVVKGSKASFRSGPQKVFLLDKGRIIEEFEDKEEAIQKINSTNTTVNNTIIIKGLPLNSNAILAKSNSKVLTREHINDTTKYFLYVKEDNKYRKVSEVELTLSYHERAALSSDGKIIVYSKGRNQYAIYNTDQKKEITFLTGNFIDFDNSGNLIFSDEMRELKIYDPVTFERKNLTPQFYTFTSPDGKLFAKTSPIQKYYNMIENKEISRDEYEKYKIEYSFNPEKKDVYIKKWLDLMNKNMEFFENLFPEEKDRSQIPMNHLLFDYVWKTRKFAIIGIVGTNVECLIEIATQISYMNYISFSYDNKYVAIVGKPLSDGYLNLTNLVFDETNSILKVGDRICDTFFGEWATWTCSFTRKGLFGTYDSKPTLYLIPNQKFKELSNDEEHDQKLLKEYYSIPNRSLMCFSDSGKYMALSIQGYRAYSLGGQGHVPSNKMFIHSTDGDYKLLDEWEYQGANVSKLSPDDQYRKNLVQAGFSKNDDKIMVVTTDGVIVVRNLHLEP